MTAIRRDYKDSLFCHLFGEEHKENALALYNALSGTTLSDAGELAVTTVSDAVYLGRKNDVSLKWPKRQDTKPRNLRVSRLTISTPRSGDFQNRGAKRLSTWPRAVVVAGPADRDGLLA